MDKLNTLLSDLECVPIPIGALAYVGQRARNSFYDLVMDKFRESGMTQAELARRLGKTPGRISQLLSGPQNWTIETVAELLAAICGEEVNPSSLRFAGRPKVKILGRESDVSFDPGPAMVNGGKPTAGDGITGNLDHGQGLQDV